jgi:hypothetical protein
LYPKRCVVKKWNTRMVDAGYRNFSISLLSKNSSSVPATG